VREQRTDRGALLDVEFRGERDINLATGVAYVRNRQARSGTLDDSSDRVA
jgi:hypothetical protein